MVFDCGLISNELYFKDLLFYFLSAMVGIELIKKRSLHGRIDVT